MKIFIITLCLLASIISLNAQNYTTYGSQPSSSSNTQSPKKNFDTNMSIQEAFNKFYNKELSYSDAPQEYLRKYFEVLNESDYAKSINRVMSAEGFSRRGPDIEVEEENGNIYTYPVAFTNAEYSSRYETGFHSYDDPGIITFYNTNLTPENASAQYVNVHGANYPAVQVGMNRIKIGNKTANLSDVFKGIIKENALPVIRPSQYLTYANRILMTLNATYSGNPSIIFTKPHYEVIGGQLMEINSGINYEVPLRYVSYLTDINLDTMSSTPIALNGITHIGVKYINNSSYIIAYDTSYYGENGSGRYEQTSISQNRSPIYLLEVSPEGVSIKASFTPREGDVIVDIQLSECGKYFYLCGTNKNQGYVGYDNPILTIIKATTFEEVARYRGKRKDRYYAEIRCIDEENIYVKYDDWCEFWFNDGRNPNHFEVINIPSIISFAK